jgi:hypothetical protein
MRTSKASATLPRRQAGVALAVGLLLLIVLTLIGLTAVRMTTQQGRMAANFQWQSDVFQGAESAIRVVVGEMRGVLDPPTGVTTNILVDAIDGATPDPQRTVGYIGQTAAPGYSMGVGEGSIVAHQFRVSATSELAAGAARARHEQGVQRVGPGAG